MRKRQMRRLFTVAATVVLSLCCACADDGAVPAVEPEPEPVPEQSEPFLTVSPDTLFYDLAGKPLGASEFVVKTNCAWQLSVPEQADWCEASPTSGRCDASVSFQLGSDAHYRVAELAFVAIAADENPVVSYPVFIQQGEKPVDPSNPDDPSDPDTPDNPDEKPGGDSSEPSDPDDPTDPSNPDDPDKNPDTPPATPAIPKIESVNPTELVWSANESGVVRQVDVTVKDFDNHVLQEPEITGADASRFEASVNGLTVYVKTTGKNDTGADYRATLEISVAGGNRVSVPLVQSKRESVPDKGDSGDNSGGDSNGDGGDGGDSNGGDDGDGGDNGGNGDSGDNGGNGDGGGNGEESGQPDDPPGGGCDDFATLTPDYLRTDLETPSGWKGFNCAVYSGDNGNDTAPYFRSLLGSSADVKGLAMYTAGGRIESPDLHGGCGSLTFRYGVTEPGKRVDFTVEIVRESGTVAKSQPVRKSVTQYEQNEFSVDVQLSGDFRIVIRNNASSTVEYTTVFQITWTGYSGN